MQHDQDFGAKRGGLAPAVARLAVAGLAAAVALVKRLVFFPSLLATFHAAGLAAVRLDFLLVFPTLLATFHAAGLAAVLHAAGLAAVLLDFPLATLLAGL